MAIKATGFYILSHFVHSWALFSIQGVLGAVWTGLLQCVRACVVFLVSGYLFCKYVMHAEYEIEWMPINVLLRVKQWLL